jgi:filamentous hemagglutinin family protein
MKSTHLHDFCVSCLVVLISAIGWEITYNATNSALAIPITPAIDGTTTRITPNGNRIDIDGGKLSKDGANLFHSFQQFGLDATQTANFISNPSIKNILGRVTGGEASLINGLIQVNGGKSNLYLMNPAGIIFGKEATLNVPASFSATTATGITFNKGLFKAFGTNNYRSLVGEPNGYLFNVTPAAIVNAGNLAVGQGNTLSLIGGIVVNTGTMQTSGGEITIVAVPETGRVRLQTKGQILSLEIAPPTDIKGNYLPFTPLMLPQLLTGSNIETKLTVNTDNTVQTASGTIIPTQTGTAIISGILDISNQDLSRKTSAKRGDIQVGGTVNIFGSQIALLGTKIDASGINGGGTVRIGGDYQGKGSVPNATHTYVSRDSIINADSSKVGDGGRVIIWADEVTNFYGNISAQGGKKFGQGGFVEVSSGKNLTFQGQVNLRANKGKFGTLLLDPENITIINGNSAPDDTQLLDKSIFASDPGGTLIISEGQIENQLTSGNVILQANNNIIINKLSDGTLGKLANNSNGSLTFTADADKNGVGDFRMNPSDTILTSLLNPNGGAINISGVNVTAGKLISRSEINIQASGNIATGEIISFKDINLIAGGSINTNQLITSGDISISGLNFNLGGANAGNITLTSNGNITTGTINASSSKDNGGNVRLTSTAGSILIDPKRGESTVKLDNGDPLIAGGAIFSFSGGSNTFDQGGDIILTAQNNITTGPIVSGSVSGNGGKIELNSSAGSINTSEGQITFRGQTIPDTGLLLSASGGNGRGGDIKVSASGNILSGPVISGSYQGNGGDINLISTKGAINTLQGLTSNQAFNAVLAIANSYSNPTLPSKLNSLFTLGTNISGSLISASGNIGTGGKIAVNAKSNISTGIVLSTSFFGDAGDIRLSSSAGNIDSFIINSQSLGAAKGGNIEINSKGLFTATSSLSSVLQQLPPGTIKPQDIPANLDRQASISSTGGTGGGDITIRHGGGLRNIDFTVGYPSINGTTGNISSGKFTLPPLSFPHSYTLGNIRIITPDTSEINVDKCTSYCKIRNNDNITVKPPTNQSSIIKSIKDIETSLSNQFEKYLGLGATSSITLEESQNILRNIENNTGIKPAIIYALFLPSIVEDRTTTNNPEATTNNQKQKNNNYQLELVLITAEGKPIRRRVEETTREQVLKVATSFFSKTTNRQNSSGYLAPAQQMYRWLITPIEKDLQARQIKNLAFIMDDGLRAIPLAALHNGKEFIIENYSVGLMPSLSLTNTRYVNLRNSSVLAMGASEFQEQNPLPAVPLELSIITGQLWPGKSYLNQSFTLENLRSVRNIQPFGIVHLATHAEFQTGDLSNSFIQLWDSKLQLNQLRQLNLNKPPVELLVLSACRTAQGDLNAELGFAGLAVQAGVKSALGSLWYVSDEGTLALMTSFYEELKQSPIKAEALRRAQLAMLKGKVRFQDGKLITNSGNFTLPPTLINWENQQLSHPYYWSAFTMIGNPW